MSDEYTIRVSGATFKTSERTLRRIEYFARHIDRDIYQKVYEIDSDPEIFRHFLNVLRDRNYNVPAPHIENVNALFQKYESDYYDFTGKRRPNVLAQTIRTELICGRSTIIPEISEMDEYHILDAWVECEGVLKSFTISIHKANLDLDLDFDVSADTSASALYGTREYSNFELSRVRTHVRLEGTSSQKTMTMYRLEDMNFHLPEDAYVVCNGTTEKSAPLSVVIKFR